MSLCIRTTDLTEKSIGPLTLNLQDQERLFTEVKMFTSKQQKIKKVHKVLDKTKQMS